MKVKNESEKVGLKLNIQKTKIMAYGPITSWQIDGETMETVTIFILRGSKITADCYCSHEIKRYLLLGRKVMTHLDSILKSRDITLPTKVHLVKAVVVPVVMYGCESWTVKEWASEWVKLLSPVRLSVAKSPWTVAYQAPQWVAASFSRSSQSRDSTRVSCICKQTLYCLSHQRSYERILITK